MITETPTGVSNHSTCPPDCWLQEYLGEGWTSCSSLTPEARQDVLPAMQEAVRRMHNLRVDGSAIVHGDLRAPNVMWREDGKLVQIVDLDWAGLEGVARYPARMARNISWHHSAEPGQVLRQDHDRHLLSSFV